MKKYYSILGIFLLMLSVSCDRFDSLDVPDFDVYVDKTTYKVGEEVIFHLKGDPDIITIYTGEIGNDIEFNNGRYINAAFKAQFDMQMLDGRQDDQVDILLSTDFDEDYTINGVDKATWKSVKDRFRLLKPQETRDYVSSGWADLTDVLENNDKVDFYLAIKYTTKNQTNNGVGNLTRLRGLTINAENSLGSDVVENHSSLNWQLFSTDNKEPDRAAIKDNLVELRSNTKNNGYDEDTEDWAVSKQISLERYSYIGPDWGTVVKSVSNQRVDNYVYTYSMPGTHKVTFVALNIHKEDTKKVVREIELVIEP